MKKIINIIVGIALVISLCGNIYLIKLMEETKGQVEVYSSKVVAADDHILGLEEKVAELERQVTDKEGEIKKLEDMIAETAPTPPPTPTEVTDPQDDIGNGAGQQLTESETTYLEEAKDLWAQNKDSFECNEETFTEAYIGLRDSEKSKEEAYTEVLDTFVKEEESQPVVTPAPQPQPEPTQQPQVQQPVSTPQPQQNSSGSTMPTPPGGNIFDGLTGPTGTGSGVGAGGSVGDVQ